MRSSFDPTTFAWELDWPGRVARHDLVYLSPPGDPLQGIPLGNGDIGALAWCDSSRLIVVINKCDLWDDGPAGRFGNWGADEEEHSTTLRHGCRLVFDFHTPFFDHFYLTAFAARLSLADATLHLDVEGPFGQLRVRAFVPKEEGLLCGEVSVQSSEPCPLDIVLERYGSRAFGHWYSLVNRDPSLGLSGTQSQLVGEDAVLTHRLTSGTFAAGLRVLPQKGAAMLGQRETSHSVRLHLAPLEAQNLQFCAAVTSPLATGAVEGAVAALDSGQRLGLEELHQAHSRLWKAFWLRSLMESGDDYLDNLWHMNMFTCNASQGGPYPGRFINGLWGWSGDVQPWTFYFHWNQQQTYWPLNTAGHHDLIESYLDYRFRALPHNRQDAKELFGVEGAFVSDVAERRGYNSQGEKENHTPVAQIAMEFWRQYQYTGDKAFLRERALPYLLEAATFFESLLEPDDQGVYHARSGTGYEGWIRLRDAITELIYARVLLTTALKALEECGADHVGASHWRTILDHLAPLPSTTIEGCFDRDDQGQILLKRGFFKGRPAPTERILAAGWGIEQEALLTGQLPTDDQDELDNDLCEVLYQLAEHTTADAWFRGDMRHYDGIFPCLEVSAAFPSGLVGLGQKGSELYDLTLSTALLYAPECCGWDTLPIALARLGAGDELSAILRRWPIRWQPYVNGFGQWGPQGGMWIEVALRFRINRVRDASLPREERDRQKFVLPMWPFRHIAMESMSVLSCAMNEALLQSHDGVIRVAPAVTPEASARFTLHAVGGFVVSAEIASGAVAFVAIESRLGNECVVKNPWPAARLYRNGRAVKTVTGDTVRFATSPADRWLLLAEGESLDAWEVAAEHLRPNEAPKDYADGRARLGLPRMY